MNRILTAIVVLALSSFAMAQKKPQQQATAEAPDTTTCAVTYTSGVGHNATKYCVTVNGTIPQFSRGGDEYIRVGDFVEGYGICDLTPSTPVAYYDYSAFDSGNWLASSFSTPTATTAISTRLTNDGIWQIKNTITRGAANASGPGFAKVAMQIKNLTGINRVVLVLRSADVDFSRGGADDFHNDFDYTIDTAYGLEPGFKSGLGITNNTFAFLYQAFADSGAGGPDPCVGPTIAPQPFFGDGGIGSEYLLAVPKLATKTITVTYKPI